MQLNDRSVIVVTDGLESSSLLSGGAFKAATHGLPEPEVALSGCEITFFGLGTGWEPNAVRHVRREWRAWMKKADARFQTVSP